MAAPFDLNDDTVVVIIGTGAGGGVLGNELAQKGVPVVALEAGGDYQPEDFVNDEWESFAQLAWLDMRTTSRELADRAGLPEPAGLDRQVGGRHDDALRRGEPALPGPRVEGADRPTGTSLARTCSTGRSTAAEMAPWYDKAEAKMGVTRTGDRPGLPGNNNYKVFEAGAKKLGYKEVNTGHDGDQLCRLRRPGRLPADRLLLPGLQVGREVVDGLYRRAAGDGHRQLRAPHRRDGAADRA